MSDIGIRRIPFKPVTEQEAIQCNHDKDDIIIVQGAKVFGTNPTTWHYCIKCGYIYSSVNNHILFTLAFFRQLNTKDFGY